MFSRSTYDNVDTTYSDFTDKLTKVINEITPVKNMCVESNTSEWVDDESFEAIRTRDKVWTAYRRSKLQKRKRQTPNDD